MCGIAGIFGAAGGTAPDVDVLQRMAAVLQHRGPDGHGLYRDPRIGLVHTRLALLDLQGGAQPLGNEDGSVWVVGNGEIFRHGALRAELQQRGHVFRTRSDIEVIVHAYEEWGDLAWARLDGQFAFALWDARQRHLWLVRDRFGILPLHYAVQPGRIVFGSEQKALLASGCVPAVFDPAAIVQVFTLWSALAPYTVFDGVRSVRPGEAVRFDGELRARHTQWWQLDLRPDPTGPRSLPEAVDRLHERLDEAVRLRLQADVPVATYLSGGLDSSVLTALAARHSTALHTFALRFEDPAFDETPAQRRLAALLGTTHHEVLCTGRDVRAHLPEVVWHCETPLLRTAPVPMFLLSDLVQKTGIKAVLTGEGADELLGGYSIFQEDRVRRFWARQPRSTMRPALFARVHDFVGTTQQRGGAMWQAFYARGLQATDDPFYSHTIRWHNTAWTSRVLSRELCPATLVGAATAAVANALPAAFAAFTALGRAQAIEIGAFLSPYLLASQGDRVALGHGVEVRYPFLDPEVVACCAGLPDQRKMRGLRNKIVLRALGARLLPPDVWQRRKQPYRAPVAAALFGPGPEDYVDELLSEARLRRSALLDAPTAIALVDKVRRSGGQRATEREAMAITGMLTLQLLTDQFVDGFAARADAATQRLRLRPPTVFVDATETSPACQP